MEEQKTTKKCIHCQAEIPIKASVCYACKKSQKKSNAKWIIIAILALCALSSFFGNDESDKQSNENPKKVSSVEQDDSSKKTKKKEEPKKEEDIKKKDDAKKKEDSSKDKFLADLEKKLDKKVAKKTYNVLKKKIGFTKLKYKKKLGGTDNYEITANGYKVVITASDKLYMIVTPHEYTWYKNGKVKNTYKEIKKKTIDDTERISYYSIAKDIVKSGLKSPSSADFPSMMFHSSEIGMSKNGKLITVSSYVDAENSFGAMIRSEWTVQFKVKDLDNLSYKTKYVNIDGSVLYGKYRK